MIFDIVQVGAIVIWIAIVSACVIGGYVFTKKRKKRSSPAARVVAAPNTAPQAVLAASRRARISMPRPALKPSYVSSPPAPAPSSSDLSTAMLFGAMAMHSSESHASAPCSAPAFYSGGGGDYGGGGASGSWDSGSSSSSDSSSSSSSDSSSYCCSSD